MEFPSKWIEHDGVNYRRIGNRFEIQKLSKMKKRCVYVDSLICHTLNRVFHLPELTQFKLIYFEQLIDNGSHYSYRFILEIIENEQTLA
jgi:hypothetical protein